MRNKRYKKASHNFLVLKSTSNDALIKTLNHFGPGNLELGLEAWNLAWELGTCHTWDSEVMKTIAGLFARLVY